MTEPTDDEFHAQFDRLRAGDTARAPSFSNVWGRAELQSRASRRAPSRIAWWVAAAGVVLALGIVRYRGGDDASLSPREAAAPTASHEASANRFTSPTAMLLQTSRHELLSPPSILSSVLDGATGPSMPRKGD